MMQLSGKYVGFIALSLLCFSLSACSGGGSSADPVPADDLVPEDSDDPVVDITPAPLGTQGYVRDLSLAECSIQDMNAWVDFDMRDYYIYYDQVPQLNLADYTDPAVLVSDLRIDPDVYSNLVDAQEQDALRTDGLTFGYGFNSNTDAEGVYRFRRILGGSPMDQAGIQRGDRLLAIDDVLIEDMTDVLFEQLLFDDGVEPVFTVQTDGEAQRSLRVVRAEYRWNTAPYATVFTMADGNRIGYLLVEGFYQPTEGDMDEHIEWLLEQGVDDFILDLRYNGGGSVRVSERLASQIAGPQLVGQPFQIRSRNDKYSELDNTSVITAESPVLSVPRLVVLTTERSASASETIINGLQPYLDVTVIGDTTNGKPFTSRAIEYCGKNLNAMHSVRTNSVGVSVEGGIQADCAVQDQWAYPTNDDRDSLTSAGLAYLSRGVCETQIAASPQSRQVADSLSFNGQPGQRLIDQPMSYED